MADTKIDKTTGQVIAERYFLDDEEAFALAKEIDQAIVKAVSQVNQDRAKMIEGIQLTREFNQLTRGLVPGLLKGIAQEIRNKI